MKIIKKYPQFFEEKPNVYVGKGWHKILLKMCQEIDLFLKEQPDDSFKINQIKEKFGSLRVYIWAEKNTEMINSIIRKYEDISAHVCEKCGLPSKIRTDLGWIQSLCLFHYNLEILSRKYFKKSFGFVKYDIKNKFFKLKKRIFK